MSNQTHFELNMFETLRWLDATALACAGAARGWMWQADPTEFSLEQLVARRSFEPDL
jgi:hypothetical protein